MSVILRAATPADAPAIHGLITSNLEAGHLLPRSLDDIRDHIPRFVVAEADSRVAGCAELARLSPAVAEVRSLVVDESCRGRSIGAKLISRLADSATVAGYSTLSAFAHEPGHFVRLGFTIVPHVWVPEKIAHDCTSCPLFRRCGQYAVRLMLHQGAFPDRVSGSTRARGVAPRRPHIERLQLTPAKEAAVEREEPVPA